MADRNVDPRDQVVPFAGKGTDCVDVEHVVTCHDASERLGANEVAVRTHRREPLGIDPHPDVAVALL